MCRKERGHQVTGWNRMVYVQAQESWVVTVVCALSWRGRALSHLEKMAGHTRGKQPYGLNGAKCGGGMHVSEVARHKHHCLSTSDKPGCVLMVPVHHAHRRDGRLSCRSCGRLGCKKHHPRPTDNGIPHCLQPQPLYKIPSGYGGRSE